MAFIEQKENDNNDNLCKIHGGLYIASALISVKITRITKFTVVIYVAFIEQKDINDNNDNPCKIHGGFYIASALIKITRITKFTRGPSVIHTSMRNK